MRVRVEKIVDERRRVLACASALGALHLVWEGEALPELGWHDVELDVPAILEWGREIGPAGDVGDAGGTDAPGLVGQLLSFDEAGMAEIRVKDGLLLVETLGEPPLGIVGQTVEVHAPSLHAHPYDL